MVNWDSYLWSGVADALNMSAHDVMHVVGVVEIVAGLVVLVRPRWGALLVAGWLATVVVNLVAVGIDTNAEYWDIALRDFGLFLGAVALFRLATVYGPDAVRRPTAA